MLDLCGSLKETLETVCEESCDVTSLDCPDTPQNIDENLFDGALPDMISLNGVNVKDKLPAEKSDVSGMEGTTIVTTTISPVTKKSPVTEQNIPVNEYSLRNEVDKVPNEKKSSINVVADSPKEATDHADVKVGAKTADSKPESGGVDKSVIGIVVAGMVVVVAGITIKKNWSSIKKKFSSSPNRAVSERSGTNVNGTTPEEVPLQDKADKSPV